MDYPVGREEEDGRTTAAVSDSTVAASPQGMAWLNGAIPLVSCVMPTRGRPTWVRRAISQFLQQDYPERELIIVFDAEVDVTPRCTDSRVRYVNAQGDVSIGAKRELGVKAARGEIIAQWDDDDWYGPQRLSRQVLPIVSGVAEVTGLTDTLFFDLENWSFWGTSTGLYSSLFYQAVAGGTLVYQRSLLDRCGGYRKISLREDAELLTAMLAAGGRLQRIDGQALFMYLRHGRNTWRFAHGVHVDPEGWRRVEEPEFFHPDRESYIHIADELGFRNRVANDRPKANPLVSCIMPTYNRRPFIRRAIECFLKQTYAERELIIIDDGEDCIDDLVPADPRIRYFRHNTRHSVGAKRNLACELANGELIAHWDDDDWISPTWLDLQVRSLLESGADICGLAEVYFYAPDQERAWRYRYDGVRPWVCGGTMCYRKAFWERNRFPDISIGEDNAFVWSEVDKLIVAHSATDHYIATVHPANTSRKNTADRRWHLCGVEVVEQILGGREETFPLGLHRSLQAW